MTAPVVPTTTGDPPPNPTQTPPAGDPPTPPPAPTTTADDEVAKAYAKLRAAEDARKQAEQRLKDIETNQLPEAERLKTENAELKAKNDSLESDLTKWAAERVAQAKGFIDPEAAIAVLRSRGTDLSDKSKTEKALDGYAQEKKGLTGDVPPPSGGPINPQNDKTEPGNAGMNQMIRRKAGRE